MNTRRQQLILILVMALLTLLVSGSTVFFLYDAAFQRERSNLSELVDKEVNLIEAVARFDQLHSQHDHPQGASAATLSQIKDAYSRKKGFGKTGEILIARQNRNAIKFLHPLRHDHDLGVELTVPYNSPNAEPMRRALNKQAGVIIGKDYRGENVLAAYGWINILDIGIVAKVDLQEIRVPFITGGLIAFAIALVLILLASAVIMRITRNSIRELEKSEEQKRLLINSTGEAIYGIDDKGNCTFANPACLNMLGYDDDSELLGKNMHMLIHHTRDDGSPYPPEACDIYNAIEPGVNVDNENEVFWRRDGSRFDVHYRSSPIIQQDKCIGAVISFTDISEQRELQRQLQNSQDTLSRAQSIAHVGHWDWNIATGSLAWSDEIYRIFGLDPQAFGATYEAFLERVHPDDSEFVTNAVNRALADTATPYDIEHRILTPDGEEKFVHERGEIYRDANNKPVRMIGVVHDITKTKVAITALAESEKKFQTLARISPVGIFRADAEGRCTYVNDYWCRLSGIDAKEAQGDGWVDALHPEDINKVQKEWNASIKENRNFKLEYRFLHPNGHEVWVLGQARAEKDENGSIISFVGTITDITERRYSELALQKSEHDVHAILDNMVDTFYRANSRGELVMVSQSIRRLLGYDIHEALGMHLADFYVHPADREQFLKLLKDHNGRVQNFEARLRHKDGHHVWVSNNAHYCYDDTGNITGTEGVVHNITDRKMAEKAMQDINQELEKHIAERSTELVNERNFISSVLDTTSAIVTVLDTEGRIVRFNRTSEKITGYRSDEVLGKPVWDILIPPAESEKTRKVFSDLTASMSQNTYENYWLTKSGEQRLISWSNSAICDENGQVQYIIATGIDITERRLAEKALAESQDTIALIVEQLDGLLYRCLNDKDWTLTFVSEGCEVLTGYTKEQFMNGEVTFGADVIHPDDQQQVWDNVQLGLKKRQPYELNYRIITADKQLKWVMERGMGHFSDNGDLLALEGFIIDNTANKNVELQLQQAVHTAEQASHAKSEFLSRMSHELRTPMNAILGFGQLLQADEENNLSEENKDFLNEILNAGNHLLELINEVLDLSRVESGTVSLNIDTLPPSAVVAECLSLISPIAGKHGIKLINRCKGIQDVRIRADRTRLKQILINLMTNAVKYNTPKGSVKISCEYMEPERMRISVSDTGPGIPEDQHERLFKPFERLDANSAIEGTGIGLAVTKRLVEMMDGKVGVDSSPGRGSTFWIELAAHRITVPVSAGKSETPVTKPYRLLLIENIPSRIKLISQLLARRDDIELSTARTAKSGLDTACKLCPDAILLNHDIPALHKFRLLEKLVSTKQTRNIPLLAISADAQEPQLLQDILDKGINTVLPDPLDITVLLQKLEQLMPRKNIHSIEESVRK